MPKLPQAWLLIASMLSTACSSTSTATGDPLYDELVMLTGPGARACGQVRIGQDPTEAWRCAQAADAQGVPYWFAIQSQGIDSQAWTAALLMPDKRRYVLEYDSNVSGGPGFLPRFMRTACVGRLILVPDRKRNLLLCSGRAR